MVGLRKSTEITEQKEGELCQEQKDRLGERHVEQNVLRAARDEDLHVQYVALGGEPPGRSVAEHARQPAVFGAQVVWSAARKGLLSVERQHLKPAVRPANRPRIQVTSSGRQPELGLPSSSSLKRTRICLIGT